MRKMDSQYNSLNAIDEDIHNIISDLEEEKDNINQNSRGRYLTDKEWERQEEIEEHITNFKWCAEHIESAMSYLEDYID